MNPFRGDGDRRGQGEHRRLIRIVHESPLRQVDPRVKLQVSVLVALAVMLPLERLAVFWLAFMALTFPLRLAREAGYQIRRIAWLLVVLFIVDWLSVGLPFAVLITLRFTLVVSAFVIFFATTRPEEFRLALEKLGLPYPYAFSLSLAFQSIALMNEEWRAIHEAQRSRGAWPESRGWRQIKERLNDLIALGVPAIVLTVKRAWTFTEAAYTRGFDSPHRKPYRQLVMRPMDWLVAIGSVVVIALVFIWR
jgi:energy-coupling factor transport system permease protein